MNDERIFYITKTCSSFYTPIYLLGLLGCTNFRIQSVDYIDEYIN